MPSRVTAVPASVHRGEVSLGGVTASCLFLLSSRGQGPCWPPSPCSGIGRPTHGDAEDGFPCLGKYSQLSSGCAQFETTLQILRGVLELLSTRIFVICFYFDILKFLCWCVEGRRMSHTSSFMFSDLIFVMH